MEMKGTDMQELFEKIIEKLKELNTIDCQMKTVTCRKWDYGTIVKAIEIVKQEAEQYNNGWIPCSSGVMPRANGWYLVTNHLGVVQEQRWSANHWEKLRDDAVLAWRELPLPYQPKGE